MCSKQQWVKTDGDGSNSLWSYCFAIIIYTMIENVPIIESDSFFKILLLL